MIRIAKISAFGVVVCALAGSVDAQDAQALFDRAYYVEVEDRNLESAAGLYEQVIKSPGAPAELVERARRRLAFCREQARSADLARLMPAEALLYAEARNPGRHLARLLEIAGLARQPGGEGAEEAGQAPFAISPRLITALEDQGLESAAVAITEVDPRTGIPKGLVVLNTGRNDLLHGLIETALAGAAASRQLEAGKPIGGRPTYMTPFGAIVVGESLVFAGNPAELALDAARRVAEGEGPAPGRSEALEELGKEREGGLLFAHVDGKKVLDAVRREMSRHGGLPDEYRLAQAIADIESFRWAAVKLGADDRGLAASVWLRLDEGNHALPYHLLRTSGVRREALRAIPHGAVGFLAVGLSDDGGAASVAPDARAGAARYITGLDLGREVFANIKEAMAFLLPWNAAPEGRRPGIPEVGLVLTVKDPARSVELWRQVLSVPAIAAGGGPAAVTAKKIEGRDVEAYSFPESVRIHLAALPDRVVLTTSESAMSRALKAAEESDSILQDDAFAKEIAALPERASKVLLVHAGRAWRFAEPMSGARGREAEQIAALLEDVGIALYTSETPTRFEASIIAGIPRVGELLGQLFREAGRPRREHPAPVPRRKAAELK
jgi:hypothetical protein